MRILLVHTYYREAGGEDIVYENEAAMLRSQGHEVFQEDYHNSELRDQPPFWGSLGLAFRSVWSRHAHARFERIINEFRPEVAHFHNTFPQVPPSVYRRCRSMGVAVVQTLHNYRLMCPSATFYRAGGVCTDCLGRRIAWPGIVHGCYRNSRMTTAAVALIQGSHRILGTWDSEVDMYIALSESSRNLFIRGGLNPDTIRVKPNFLVSDVGLGEHNGGYAIFVGRLSREKGLQTLINAWEFVDPEFTLTIVGDGPLRSLVAEAAERNPSIKWLGWRSPEQVLDLVGSASILVFPSEWHETFGRTIVEAFSRGTPVIASDLGAAQELIHPGVNGLRFEAGNASDLARQAKWIWSNPDQLACMRAGARSHYEQKFTAEKNYKLLMSIYSDALSR